MDKRFLKLCLLLVVLIALYLVLTGAKGKLASYIPEIHAPTSSGSPSASPALQGTSISDSVITVPYLTEKFGLATTPEQVLTKSMIPLCEGGFTYCFYYLGREYDGTNFRGAAVGITRRDDMATERLCLDTPLREYTSAVPDIKESRDSHSFVIYQSVGEGAAGSYTNGAAYRLFVRNGSHCYEIETKTAVTQFENYPAGTIKEFTNKDSEKMRNELEGLINSISLGTEKNLFK